MQPLRAVWTDKAVTNQRSAARRTLRLDVSATASMGAGQALIHNLSVSGVLIESSVGLQVGETIEVDLPQAGPTRAIVLRVDSRLAGCEFVNAVSQAAISAALLRNPVVSATPELPSVQFGKESNDLFEVRAEGDRPPSTAILLTALIVSLILALMLIVALLTFPFST